MDREGMKNYSKILSDLDHKRKALFEQDGKGRTLLFYAAERGELEKVREMIFRLGGTGISPARLALITIKDKSGLTAADLAEQNSHPEIVQLLRGEEGRMEFYG